MKTQEELKNIYDSLTDSEKYGLQFGLFPAKLLKLNLDSVDCANLIRCANHSLPASGRGYKKK